MNDVYQALAGARLGPANVAAHRSFPDVAFLARTPIVPFRQPGPSGGEAWSRLRVRTATVPEVTAGETCTPSDVTVPAPVAGFRSPCMPVHSPIVAPGGTNRPVNPTESVLPERA